MKLEEIKVADIDTLEARAAEILSENSEELTVEDLEARADESEAIEERMKELRDAYAKEQEVRDAIANDEVKVSVLETTIPQEETKMDMKEFRNSEKYVNAYAEYIKSENDTELRALISENVEGGTVAVPDIVYDIVKTAWNEEGIMSLVKKTYIQGNFKVSFEISATGAVVHTEGSAAPAEETLTLGIVNLVPVSIKKWIKISDEVYDLRGEAFINYIYTELAHQIAKKAADEIIAKIEAAGTSATATTPAVPAVKASAIAMGTIAEAIGNLSDEAANPVIIMNKTTWPAFKAVQYANGYGADPFEGLKVVFNNSIKAFSAASTGDTYAIVGDLGQGAIANFPNGEEIKFTFDDKSLAEADLIKIVGRQYVGLGIVANDAFVKIQK